MDHVSFVCTCTDGHCHRCQITVLRVKPRKEMGPRGFRRCVLRACVDSPAGAFVNIFNLSQLHSTFPSALRSSLSAWYKRKASCRASMTIDAGSNIQHQEMLLVAGHGAHQLQPHNQPWSTAIYPPPQQVHANNISLVLHLSVGHFDNMAVYNRLLFIDYSSDFNPNSSPNFWTLDSLSPSNIDPWLPEPQTTIDKER